MTHPHHGDFFDHDSHNNVGDVPLASINWISGAKRPVFSQRCLGGFETVPTSVEGNTVGGRIDGDYDVVSVEADVYHHLWRRFVGC